MTLRSIIAYVLTAAAVLTFAAVGLYHVAQALPNWPRVSFGDPLATTDIWLASAVESASPSETLAQSLQAIPGNGSLLFVGATDTEYQKTYYAAQYLAGLRPMTLLVCVASGQAAYHLTDPASVDAVITLAPSPASGLIGGHRLGSHFSITPTTNKYAWPQYCP
ncbi:MAG: hypothetical protein U0822_14035 [Anaerolineae bacterium]